MMLINLLTGFLLLIGNPELNKSDVIISYAYDFKSGDLLYNEIHSEKYSGNRLERRISEFVDVDGKIISRRIMEFKDDLTKPNFRIEDFRIGYLEGAEVIDSQKVLVYKRESFNEVREEAILTLDGNYVIDGGLTYFFQQNWKSLMEGNELEFNFISPNRLDYYSFRVYKNDITEINGREGMRLILEPAGFILRQFVDPILITYDLTSKDILYYEGISNVYDEKGNIYNVKIDYTIKEN